MSNTTPLDYIAFSVQLSQHKIVVTPAEIHGLISGMFAAGLAKSDPNFMVNINDLMNEGQAFSLEIKKQIEALREQSFEQLSDALFGFELFLPDDDLPLEDRAQALAQWVQSFVLGFGIIQTDLKKTSEDAQELIGDFTEISQLSFDDSQSVEESEQAYMQIVEYVRVGCISLFAELNTPDIKGPVLH
ncbi:UPF0149 family protein [Alginatibacterium sediminis]|uniref:UPF0149 family protein n=1 Tax=Alginatibacterium sediminis TaxID=2164068 RepID=UPI001314FE51|nr:UPF0149 family protein [Alginatibacterium sediminis]